MCSIINESTPVARKEHYCNLCGCIIHKGQRYKRQVNNYDGDIGTHKCHIECDNLAVELDMFSECMYNGDGLTDEMFQNWVWDYVCDTYHGEKLKALESMSNYDKVKVILNDLNENKE